MSIQHITILLEFCLKIPISSSRVGIMNSSMDAPISPIVVHLFMEVFETKAINTALHPPRVWLRYVDYTFIIQKAEHSQHFLQHMDSSDAHIQFTA